MIAAQTCMAKPGARCRLADCSEITMQAEDLETRTRSCWLCQANQADRLTVDSADRDRGWSD